MSSLILEDYLPATLTVPPMTDEAFAEFCAEHPDLFFEMTAEGDLIVLAPVFTLTGVRNSRISCQLGTWADHDGNGVANGSSGSFVLPNGARRSPDASWIRKAELRKLSEKSLRGYWHLCPSFVIELKCESVRVHTLRKKMREYMENGAELGWLIDADARTVEVFRRNAQPEFLAGIDSIQGEGPVAGFVLNLLPVWDPLQER